MDNMRKKLVLILILVFCVIAAVLFFASKPKDRIKKADVSVWLTTGDQSKLLNREGDIGFTKKSEAQQELTITVDKDKKYQEIDGFGASLTDSSAWLIQNKLNEEQRKQLMNALFDHRDGIGISYLRLPMGSSDFALSNYTYNDLPEGQTDQEMKQFSIAHDKEYIIPTLQQALEINPKLKVMGSPWSPPAWMKTSGSLIKGKLKEDSYGAYANYFVQFIKAYEAEGLPVDAITVQNEPHHEPESYPGMIMEAKEQADFIKNHLGPSFQENDIPTKIIAWDHNWDEYYYPIEVLDDPEANQYIAGTAFHGYAGDVFNQQYVYDEHPDKDIYFTESSGGEWASNFADNLQWDVQTLIIGATKNWAKTVLKWNLALDETNGPTNGGCQDCRGIVTIDQQTGEVTYNEEYYSFGHASKFVFPGAHRIESSLSGAGLLSHVAFQNPDGSIALIVLNTSWDQKSFSVQSGEKTFSHTIPAGAVATYVWKN
jgi:glucosylceramidase